MKNYKTTRRNPNINKKKQKTNKMENLVMK